MEDSSTLRVSTNDYAVAIGYGIIIKEDSFGEIQVATPNAKLRALVDGTLEVNDVLVGKDPEIVHALRSLLGYPLPGRPNSREIAELFSEDCHPSRSSSSPVQALEDSRFLNEAHRSVRIGPAARAEVDDEIVFRNRRGDELRIRPGEHRPPEEILEAMRKLFRLPASGSEK